MNVWISSDSTCLGSNKPHPWAAPETSHTLPFSLRYSVKTPLNLAKATYFPDTLASDQSLPALLIGRGSGLGTGVSQETSVPTWPQLKSNSAKGWTCPPQHLYPKLIISHAAYPELKIHSQQGTQKVL